MIRGVVTDLEGTTTSITFVHDVLFPYASRELDAFVRERGREPEVARCLDELAALGRAEDLLPDPVAVARAFMAADRKVTPLKRLQGLIWEAGYANGALIADVYPDVAPRLTAWRAAGRRIAVFSSGSVHAQKLLLGHTTAGDLRPLVDAWFDTEVGSKIEASSYVAIARSLALPPAELLFLSDSRGELIAARAAGWMAIGLARDGALPAAEGPWARTFDTVD